MTMPEGTWTSGSAAPLGLTPGKLPGVPGGGDALALPTEPGSLKPWALFSSGPSKKLRLNSLPASNDTSGVRVSGAGVLPRPALSDWSILKTSILVIDLLVRRSLLDCGSPFAFHLFITLVLVCKKKLCCKKINDFSLSARSSRLRCWIASSSLLHSLLKI